MGKWICKQLILVLTASTWDLSSWEHKALGAWCHSLFSLDTDLILGWKGNSSLVPLMEGESLPHNHFRGRCGSLLPRRVSVVVVRLLLSLTLWNPMYWSISGSSVLHCLPEFAQIHVHWVGDAIKHLILCRPLLLLPSIFPSVKVFSSESALRFRWPKYWRFSFSISPSNEYSGLISFRMDWLDLLAVQGTLKSLLQYYSSKAPILWCSAFFMVQLSHHIHTWPLEKP